MIITKFTTLAITGAQINILNFITMDKTGALAQILNKDLFYFHYHFEIIPTMYNKKILN